jgi:hypothetical protein
MMYVVYIMKRTQIYLDAEQDAKLARRAIAAGVTKSTMIREAIDAYLASPDEAVALDRFRAALDDVATAPAAFADGGSYVERMRRGDEDRDAEIERRRR